ncbi:hypothetical protein MFLAVUS_005162 [Mucor flavus]|uniref:Kinetochore protein Spc24 n=1 Tax=Mucor flavus TaxID=439312 RepID=A0ABP9YXZ2_9FUNG
MTGTLETTLSRLDDLCLEVEKSDFFSPKKRSKEEIEAYYDKIKHTLNEEQFIIRGKIVERKMQQYESKVVEKNLRRDKLLSELQDIEQHILNESDDDAIERNLKSETLKLVIYRKMGIQMQVEDDYPVRKAILTTRDGQDIRTIPIENHNTKQIVKNIWEFISKDLK